MISTTPADTLHVGATPARTVTLTGTWFARVGLRPYSLLGIVDRTPGTRAPIQTLPRLTMAA